MKLWRETAEGTLALTDELPDLMANYAKKLFALDHRFVFADEPARLAALYVLRRYDPATTSRVDIRPLSERDSLAVLLAHTANRSYLLPTEQARLLPLYARLVRQAPVRLLHYPSGFGFQDEVREALLKDVAGR
jgi:hypothetical protein